MEIHAVGASLAASALAAAAGFLFWRHILFFRNPSRTPPIGDNIVSPADGTIVYVKCIQPHEEAIAIKKGISARLRDIVPEDLSGEKIHIGIFMSPFNVHYNRAPLAGHVEFIRHYPPVKRNVHMGPMHLRTILKRPPHYRNSLHIVRNERTVTRFICRFKEHTLPVYVVQIAGKSVSGIEIYMTVGSQIEKGAVFGMIRVGSQVDLVVPAIKGMQVRVRPGDRVRAGETILID
jgi:phosphatidylserine decarboxylase